VTKDYILECSDVSFRTMFGCSFNAQTCKEIELNLTLRARDNYAMCSVLHTSSKRRRKSLAY